LSEHDGSITEKNHKPRPRGCFIWLWKYGLISTLIFDRFILQSLSDSFIDIFPALFSDSLLSLYLQAAAFFAHNELLHIGKAAYVPAILDVIRRFLGPAIGCYAFEDSNALSPQDRLSDMKEDLIHYDFLFAMVSSLNSRILAALSLAFCSAAFLSSAVIFFPS
jgi:hypothetical protein